MHSGRLIDTSLGQAMAQGMVTWLVSMDPVIGGSVDEETNSSRTNQRQSWTLAKDEARYVYMRLDRCTNGYILFSRLDS